LFSRILFQHPLITSFCTASPFRYSYYGSLVYELLEKLGNQATSVLEKTVSIRADGMTTQYLNFLYYPLKQLSFCSLKLYEVAIALGDPETYEPLLTLVFVV